MIRITLLTDFGTEDGFVGALKGVLAREAPGARTEDVSHSIDPGDIRKASFVLGRFWREYPPGTVHLVVVDPGVGTLRRGLALRAENRFFVGPDNGVFARVLSSSPDWTAVKLSNEALLPSPSSRTFHGRDLFAPAAALLANGTPLEALGEPVSDPILLPAIPWRRQGDWIEGEVVEVDRFGNLATNLPGDLLEGCGQVEMNGITVMVRGTYGDAEPGGVLALINSDGFLEVATRGGSAAKELEVGVGAGVRGKIGPRRGE